MSVIGATDWYSKVDDPEKDLVAGQYPIHFLREVHQLMGANFFNSLCEICCTSDIIRRTTDGPTELVVAGTMLPFDPLHHDSKSITSYQRGRLAHPSTESWHMADNGKVIMHEVGIVASTDDELDEGTNQDLMAMVNLPTSEAWQCTAETVNLHKKIRELFPSKMKHAVCIHQGDHQIRGVILMAVLSDEEDATTYSKIGDFFIEDVESVPEIQTWDITEWEIL